MFFTGIIAATAFHQAALLEADFEQRIKDLPADIQCALREQRRLRQQEERQRAEEERRHREICAAMDRQADALRFLAFFSLR